MLVVALLGLMAFAGAADAATLTLTMGGPGSGSVMSDPFAFTCQSACQVEIADGTQVTLIPLAGHLSVTAPWTGACAGQGSGYCTLTMTGDLSVTANFALSTNVLVSRSGTGTGAVTSGPSGIDCGTKCGFGFIYGSTVALTATAGPGSSFTGWTGRCSGSAPTCSLQASESLQQVGATFTLLPVALTVTRQGTGTGTVTSSPAGIDCGSTCHYSFVNGATVTLTELPAPGSGFTGWSGSAGCPAMVMTCTMTLKNAQSVRATFTALPATLTIATTGAGSGSVTSTPIGIACGSVCSASFADGASVALTAAPAAHSIFSGWSGACTGAVLVCTVSVAEATGVVARFELAPEPLTVRLAGSGAGTVGSSPAGIDCAASEAGSDPDSDVTCGADFTHGTLVTLTAVAGDEPGNYDHDGSYFLGWTGACTGMQPTCTVSVDGTASVTATFTYFVTLAVHMPGSGHGTVVSNPLYVFCTAECTTLAPIGEAVQLGALPSDDSAFTGWSGACSGTGDCVVPMDEAASVTANFALLFRASISLDGTGHGTVTTNPGGLSCVDLCRAHFFSPGDVTLTAVPQPGSSFTGWKGACTGTAPTCVVPPDLAAGVDATFDQLPVQLVVQKKGTGTGTVTSADGDIDCGSACSTEIPARKFYTLTAVAAPGSSFAGWGGDWCGGVALSCTVWSDTDASATAIFTADPPAPAEPDQPVPPSPAPSDPSAPAPAPAQAPAGVTPAAGRAKARPVWRARPRLIGLARVGRRLVCSRGTWTGEPTRYAFTWLRDGKIVARGASRLIRKADRGHSIRCVVTAVNAGGSAAATTSARRIRL